MPCHCPLNSRKADWARTEDEVEKTASFRGTKARRATTRRGSPRNRGVCEWGRGDPFASAGSRNFLLCSNRFRSSSLFDKIDTCLISTAEVTSDGSCLEHQLTADVETMLGIAEKLARGRAEGTAQPVVH